MQTQQVREPEKGLVCVSEWGVLEDARCEEAGPLTDYGFRRLDTSPLLGPIRKPTPPNSTNTNRTTGSRSSAHARRKSSRTRSRTRTARTPTPAWGSSSGSRPRARRGPTFPALWRVRGLSFGGCFPPHLRYCLMVVVVVTVVLVVGRSCGLIAHPPFPPRTHAYKNRLRGRGFHVVAGGGQGEGAGCAAFPGAAAAAGGAGGGSGKGGGKGRR